MVEHTHWRCDSARRTWNPMHRLVSALDRNRHPTAIFHRGLAVHIRRRYHRAECCSECSLLADGIQKLIQIAEHRLGRSYERRPHAPSNLETR